MAPADMSFPSAVTPVDAPYRTLEGEELCFLCVEDCDVWFLDDDAVDDDAESDKKPQSKKSTGAWLDVTVPQSHWARSKPENAKDETNSDVCPHCRLILTSSMAENDGQAPSLCLFADGPRFDGTIHDTKPSASRCRCKSHKLRQRSDAALMVGAALSSHDLGQFAIQTIKVGTQSVSSAVPGSPLRKAKATILITFTCVEIHRKPTINGACQQRGVRRYLTNSSKPFPPSTQLLMSLVRSDWEYYDATMSRIINGTGRKDEGGSDRATSDRRVSTVSFFPSKMTLENAYDRIGGASLLSDWYFGTEPSRITPEKRNKIANITMPPEDVLCLVGSYLTASSLYATRCTCKRLYRALRAVVPGLKLKLYQHQVKSLLWMRWRETKLLYESDLAPIDNQSRVQRRVNAREADAHRAATGGASLILSPRDSSEGIRISQVNGDELEVPADSILARPLARGGLLCDDPGLGKTITVISLILQTLGLSTEKKVSDGDQAISVEHENVDDLIFKAYWKENIVQDFRRREMTQFFNAFLKSSTDVHYLYQETDMYQDGVAFENAICLKEIKARIEKDVYLDSFDKFETDVRLCFTNVIMKTGPDWPIHEAAGRLLISFAGFVRDFKNKQVQTARKCFSRTSRRPNSGVAAFVEQTNAKRLNDALLPSSGTLLVVPSVLLDHWVEQMKCHVDPAFCTEKTPIICDYSGSNNSAAKVEQITTQCKIDKTHFPLLFVDRTSNKKLPPASFLAMFRIVLTTNQRFSNEWSNGSFESELQKKDEKEKNNLADDDRHDRYRFYHTPEEASPLLKINWLRMIVDEGHSMGKGKDSSHILFASWICAERRWAMTGTPTKQTSSQTGLVNILNLMQYLNHDFFTRRLSGDVIWNQLITRGWNRGQLASFFRLRSLFSLLMVRHTKNDIEELSPPIYNTKILPMSQEEVTTYNTLVCGIQSNLLLTSMKGKTSGLQDSLLHKSQTKHAIAAISNLRLVCVGGTQVRPTLSQKNWDEFLGMFDAANKDEENRKQVRQFISRATIGSLSPCNCCNVMLSSLLVFPCGHLVCTECVDNETSSCIVCDKDFDVDEFQKLQPGFVFDWLHNIEEEARLRRQGAANGGVGAPANNVGNNGNGNGLNINARNNNAAAVFQGGFRVARPGDGHECEYLPETPGVCHLCFKQHEECYMIDEERKCSVCHLQAEDCPLKETKPYHIVDKISCLYRESKAAQAPSVKFKVLRDLRAERRPLKVIVFSQFRKTLNQTGDRLLRRFGSGCIAEYWGTYRKKELQKFVHDEKCVCMLLGKDGSEGLDLSFVTVSAWKLRDLHDELVTLFGQ
ncbi:MAG: hypothetical protein SGILL_005327, partial [Bacillariaceae sp.]